MNKTTTDERIRRHLEAVIKISGYMIGTEFSDLPPNLLFQQIERLRNLQKELSADGDINHAVFVDGFVDGTLRKKPPEI